MYWKPQRASLGFTPSTAACRLGFLSVKKCTAVAFPVQNVTRHFCHIHSKKGWRTKDERKKYITIFLINTFVLVPVKYPKYLMSKNIWRKNFVENQNCLTYYDMFSENKSRLFFFLLQNQFLHWQITRNITYYQETRAHMHTRTHTHTKN